MHNKIWITRSTLVVSIGADPTDSEEERLKKLLLVMIALMIIPAALLWGSIYWFSGEATAALVPLTYAIVSSASIALFGITKGFRLFRFSQLVLILVLPIALQIALGGFLQGSGVVLWSWLAPLGALLLADRRQAVWWFLAFAGVLVIGGASEAGVERVNNMPTWLRTVFFVMNPGAVASITFVALRYFNGQRDRAMVLLEREHQRSEQLLRNVLPPSIATLLKDNGQIIAKHHAGASILFADIVDFTFLSSSLAPEDVVEMLNGVFSAFDQLTEKLQLEKIKTIGDSYMVAAGVPEPRTNHAEVLAELALEMMATVESRTFNGHRLVLRIGINSGPVVAGVIGIRKFSYDLWGDTVNIASRIEESGIAGEIQVSDTTREKLDHRFQFETQLPIEMKGKGLVRVHLLKGRKH